MFLVDINTLQLLPIFHFKYSISTFSIVMNLSLVHFRSLDFVAGWVRSHTEAKEVAKVEMLCFHVIAVEYWLIGHPHAHRAGECEVGGGCDGYLCLRGDEILELLPVGLPSQLLKMSRSLFLVLSRGSE